MDEPLPVGLGIRVPPPTPSSLARTSLPPPPPMFYNTALPAVSVPTTPAKINISEDGLCEFDELDLNQVCVYNYLLAKYRSEPSIR